MTSMPVDPDVAASRPSRPVFGNTTRQAIPCRLSRRAAPPGGRASSAPPQGGFQHPATPSRLLPLLLTCLCTGPLLPAADGGAAADADGKKAERTATSVSRVGKASGEGEAFRLFILSGQSNMAALSEREYIIPALIEAFPDDELLIVKDSRSGQPIRRWYKGWQPGEGWKPKNGRDKPGNDDLYQKLMGMVRDAVGERRPDTICFLWMQGEADAMSGQGTQYEESLRGLIAQLRADLGRPDLTAVIGRISDHRNGESGWDAVRAAQRAVAEGDPLVHWFDTDDINGSKNVLHYMKGYKDLGARFVAHAIELVRPRKP